MDLIFVTELNSNSLSVELVKSAKINFKLKNFHASISLYLVWLWPYVLLSGCIFIQQANSICILYWQIVLENNGITKHQNAYLLWHYVDLPFHEQTLNSWLTECKPPIQSPVFMAIFTTGHVRKHDIDYSMNGTMMEQSQDIKDCHAVLSEQGPISLTILPSQFKCDGNFILLSSKY